MTARILLEGLSGVFSDERYLLVEGSRSTIGRSRTCEVSAATTRVARNRGRAALESDRAYRRISRRHFEVVFESTSRIVVRDLSRNGIRIGPGIAAEAVFALSDLDDGVEIVFGERERVRLRAVTESPSGSSVDDGSQSGMERG